MKLKELFNDALPLIQKFAPTFASAIGGPFGCAAGYVLPILANVFGTHPTDIKTLSSNILNDPNAKDKLEAAEEEHGNLIDSLMDSVNNLSKAEINIKLEWQQESITS